MSDPNDKLVLFKLQSIISFMERDTILQVLTDRFGSPVEYAEKNTVYRRARLSSVRVTESLESENGECTITSLGEYRQTIDNEYKKRVFCQHIVNSKIQGNGNVHEFLQAVGQNFSHTWVERGYLFTEDKFEIRVFSIFDKDDNQIDADNVAIIFQAIQSSTAQQQTIVDKLNGFYETFINGHEVFTPETR